METQGIWTQQFTIHGYMGGNKELCGLPHLANFLQEIASQHAVFHKVGFNEMIKIDCAWVLNKLQMEVVQYPKWHQKIKIDTWVQSMKGPISYRHYEAFDEKGKLLFSAVAVWVLMHTELKKPHRINFDHFPILANKHASCGTPNKIRPLDHYDFISDYTVKRSDRDELKISKQEDDSNIKFGIQKSNGANVCLANMELQKNKKKTLIFGASIKPERYSYKAASLLLEHGHEIVMIGGREAELFKLPIRKDRPQLNDIDTVTLYLGSDRQETEIDYILSLQPRRIIFNPGTENPVFYKKAKEAGI